MMIRLLFSLLLLLPAPAFAEEVAPAPEPVVEAPAPQPEQYTPPAEASEGVGGWAVVNPETGQVHGVLVCTVGVCGPDGEWGGVTHVDYMGCPSGCLLRFQTRATSDGNVAGVHGENVRYNSSDATFDVTHTVNTDGNNVGAKVKLVPSKTNLDGKSISTGYENIQIKSIQKVAEETATVETVKENYADTSTSVKVKLSNLPDNTFEYDSVPVALELIDSDVDQAVETQGINDSIVISTIKELTNKVKEFLQGIFIW